MTIGSVKRVMVHYNQATNDNSLPVIIELEKNLINERLGEPLTAFTGAYLEERVRSGMRASLQAESLVTGVLYVEMRRNPNAPPPVFHQLVKRYPEIPTEPTQIQQLMENLASLDIKGISTNINGLITRLDKVLDNLQTADISAGVTNTLASLNQLITSPDITNTLASVRTTLDQYKALAENLNGRIDPLADSITNSLAAASSTLAQLRGAADNLRSALRPDAPLQHDLGQLLRQLAGTGRIGFYANGISPATPQRPHHRARSAAKAMKTRKEVQSLKAKVQSREARAVGAAGSKPDGIAALAWLLRLSAPARLLLALAVVVSLTGCFGFLKPAKPTARHFVLSALPAAKPAATPSGGVAVGVGPVKIAAYLFNTSFAVPQGHQRD